MARGLPAAMTVGATCFRTPSLAERYTSVTDLYYIDVPIFFHFIKGISSFNLVTSQSWSDYLGV